VQFNYSNIPGTMQSWAVYNYMQINVGSTFKNGHIHIKRSHANFL